MLTNVPLAAAVTAPKQIVVRATNTGAVMYEVPAGRKFVGAAYNDGNMQLQINNQSISNSSANNYQHIVPLTLVAGTKVTSGSSYYSWVLMGVESDA